jgi:hypothetical protein
MSERKGIQDTGGQKKRGFFERLIVGNSVPKLRKKKVIRKIVSETPEIVLSQKIPNSFTVSELRDVLKIQQITQEPLPEKNNTSVGGKVIVPKLPIIEPIIEEKKPKEPVIKKLTVSIARDVKDENVGDVEKSTFGTDIDAKKYEPVLFDESALFVPLRNTKEEDNHAVKFATSTSSGYILSETEYFYLDSGRALTSLQDFLVYVESLSDDEWKRSVRDRKSNFALWIETVFGTGKLARLIELADSQKEAVLYIRSFLEK